MCVVFILVTVVRVSNITGVVRVVITRGVEEVQDVESG